MGRVGERSRRKQSGTRADNDVNMIQSMANNEQLNDQEIKDQEMDTNECKKNAVRIDSDNEQIANEQKVTPKEIAFKELGQRHQKIAIIRNLWGISEEVLRKKVGELRYIMEGTSIDDALNALFAADLNVENAINGIMDLNQ